MLYLTFSNLLISYTLQNELPYNEEVFESLCKRIQELEELNSNQPIPELREAQQNLDFNFAHAAELAEGLEARLAQYQTEKGAWEEGLEEQLNWLGLVRDKLVEADNVAGTDDEILERLDTVKVRGVR